MRRIRLFSLLVVGLAFSAAAQQVPQTEYAQRRAELLERFPDGIVLVHARPSPAGLGEHHFKQDTSFFYFTGLGNQPAAILVLDGPKKETRLFVPPAPMAFGSVVEGVSLTPGDESARNYGLSSVAPWDDFVGFVNGRLSQGARTLYIDESRRPQMTGNPKPLLPISGDKVLWRLSLEQAFPEADIESAAAAIREMRWVKSPAEVAVLREVARTTTEALLAGIRVVGTGKTQKETEAAVVCGCIAAGAGGPAFWPWTMSGPNAHREGLVRTMFDYHHLNRTMNAGELVRMDVGCALGHYEGDVGRTVPVSGKFNSNQREAWDMLIRAYRAGLSTMRAGVSLTSVREASQKEIERTQDSLQSDYTRRGASTILASSLREVWHIHGVGLDGGETGTDRLEAGSVIAFEPMFSVDEDAFYLEDMILITETGHEILSKGLPYTAEEIEAVMSGR